jgi:hypothetical protein
LLIKPSHTFLKGFPSWRRNAGHALLCDPIPEEGKTALDPPDERLVGVLLHPQFPERLVDELIALYIYKNKKTSDDRPRCLENPCPKVRNLH